MGAVGKDWPRRETRKEMNVYKVALITNIPAPYRIPLFQSLADHPKIQLTVYYCATSERNREWSTRLNSGYNYHFLHGWTIGTSFHINPGIVPLILKQAFDVVIVGGYGYPTVQMAVMLLKMIHQRWILLSDGGFVKPESRLVRTLKSWLIRGANAYLVSGTAAKEHLEHYGAKAERIFNAYFTCDVDYFRSSSSLDLKTRGELRRLLRLQGTVFLYVGRLMKGKGLFTLLDAYARVEAEGLNTSLLLVGDGPLRAELEQWVHQREIKGVRFTGFVQINGLPKCYGIADVFVFPSTIDRWGLVINEAMACSLPVITTSAVGAARDLVKDGWDGFVIEPGDVEELYQRMKELAINERLRQQFSQHSAERIAQWTNAEAVEGFVKAIQFAGGKRSG